MDFEDKPRTMPLKDFLVRILSVKNRMSEKTIDAIITHQYKSTNEAMATNDSLEISGFGVMRFNVNKAKRRRTYLTQKVEAMAALLGTDKETSKTKHDIEFCTGEIEWLNNKLKRYEFPTDNRGMEK